jgi:hypothetical protein
MLWNKRTGKNQVIVVCRDRAHADEVCARLNRGDHGTLWL